MDETPELLEPASLLLTSRNFYMIIIVIQLFLVINGTYLYGISTEAALIYMTMPAVLMVYMVTLTKSNRGKPVTMEMLEGSMKGRYDPISDYLKAANKQVSYLSLGIQLIYLSFGFMIAFVAFLMMARQGWLEVGTLDAIQARSAIVFTMLLVAPSETIIFQALIPLWIALTFAESRNQMYLTYIISQSIFATYHWSAYGGAWASVAFAFFMGIIFLFIARTFGIPAAIGVHGSWNLVIYGVGQPLIGA